MSISKKEVRHIASLARIGVSEEEVEKFSKDLSSILEWIEQLKEVDVSKVLPTAHITGLKNRFKEDLVKEFEGRERIIKSFPEEKNDYNKVKSVL